MELRLVCCQYIVIQIRGLKQNVVIYHQDQIVFRSCLQSNLVKATENQNNVNFSEPKGEIHKILSSVARRFGAKRAEKYKFDTSEILL